MDRFQDGPGGVESNDKIGAFFYGEVLERFQRTGLAGFDFDGYDPFPVCDEIVDFGGGVALFSVPVVELGFDVRGVSIQ